MRADSALGKFRAMSILTHQRTAQYREIGPFLQSSSYCAKQLGKLLFKDDTVKKESQMRSQTQNSDLHEGAVEKGPLRNDKVGANTAGHCLLNGT